MGEETVRLRDAMREFVYSLIGQTCVAFDSAEFVSARAPREFVRNAIVRELSYHSKMGERSVLRKYGSTIDRWIELHVQDIGDARFLGDGKP
jgi:hypothetical protein